MCGGEDIAEVAPNRRHATLWPGETRQEQQDDAEEYHSNDTRLASLGPAGAGDGEADSG